MTELFEDGDYFTGPALDSGMVRRAEKDLGVRLPRSYIEVLRVRNGGIPRRRRYPTSFPTSWAEDHFEISHILGIGGLWGIDSSSGAGSSYMIAEWGYPEIGVVICATPSAGHDTVMLDYSECGPEGEPAVVYVGEDRVPRRVAQSFDEFLARLSMAAVSGGSGLEDPVSSGRLLIRFAHPRAAYRYADTSPRMLIDGAEVRVPYWGTHSFPVKAGQRRVQVWVPYSLPRKAGKVRAEVTVTPGGEARLEYMAPTLTFLRGSLGKPGEQRSAGLAAVRAFNVIMAVAVLVGLVSFLLG